MTNDDFKKWKAVIKTIIFIGVVLLVVLNFGDAVNILGKLYAVIAPLLLGAIMAFVLNILVNFYEKFIFEE